MIGDVEHAGRQVDELRAERDRLLRALREIDEERDAGELPAPEHAALQSSYTEQAAGVLRQLEELEAVAAQRTGSAGAVDAHDEDDRSDAPAPMAPEGAKSRPRRAKVAIVVAGLMLIGTGAGLLVSAASGSRQAGQSVSGTVPPSAAQDLAAARQAMGSGDDTIALKLYRAVLQIEPNQPEALAYSGWLLRLAGDAGNQPALITEAVAAERAAERADPSYPDPHFFLGLILLDDLHQPTAAVPELQSYLASNPAPAVQAAVKPVLARAQQEAASAGGTSGGPTPSP